LIICFAGIILVMGAHPAVGQTLYGFGFLGGQTTFAVFTIDPVTGAFTPVVPFVPTGSGVANNSVALDPVGRRLFFVTPDGTLNTVNLTTGVTTQATMPNCCAFLQFDAGRGILYGFGFLAGQTTFSVFTIDPATGAFTAVVPFVPVGSGVASNSVALDPAGQRLFFMSPDGILNTVNLTTGVTTQATMPNCCAFLLVSAQTSANIPLLGPTALLCLLVALSLVGQHVLQRHHKNGVSET
jgi:6-phosphogluconolactonase (cycloisomerase 2 family)